MVVDSWLFPCSKFCRTCLMYYANWLVCFYSLQPWWYSLGWRYLYFNLPFFVKWMHNKSPLACIDIDIIKVMWKLSTRYFLAILKFFWRLVFLLSLQIPKLIDCCSCHQVPSSWHCNSLKTIQTNLPQCVLSPRCSIQTVCIMLGSAMFVHVGGSLTPISIFVA